MTEVEIADGHLRVVVEGFDRASAYDPDAIVALRVSGSPPSRLDPPTKL